MKFQGIGHGRFSDAEQTHIAMNILKNTSVGLAAPKLPIHVVANPSEPSECAIMVRIATEFLFLSDQLYLSTFTGSFL
jgi:hypothetical protein